MTTFDVVTNTERALLYRGDCIEVMRSLPDACVDAVVTDPPYDLVANKKGGSGVASVNLDSPYGRSRIGTGNGAGGFMGKEWDSTGIAFDATTWREVLRVLKPGGHLLAFGGTRTYHRMTCAIEDAGFEIRDSIHWMYGSGFPKSHNLDGEHAGRGTALKPAHEPIVVARKPLVGTVAKNVEAHGTGAINVDACRVDSGPSSSVERRKHAAPQESVGPTGWTTPARPAAYNEQRAGEMLGRWPPNVVFSHLDECTEGGACAEGCAVAELDAQSEGASRFFPAFRYNAKASKKDRGAGNNHPTVKPIALMQWLVRLVTPPNGIVLDPFTGSGTTGVACIREGFTFVGIEREESYATIARSRLDAAEEEASKHLHADQPAC